MATVGVKGLINCSECTLCRVDLQSFDVSWS